MKKNILASLVLGTFTKSEVLRMQDFFISSQPLLLAKESCQEIKKARKCFTFWYLRKPPRGRDQVRRATPVASQSCPGTLKIPDHIPDFASPQRPSQRPKLMKNSHKLAEH